jgi:hypothetical protein
MKTTRIDIEGPNGTATITRDGRCIHITGERLVKAIETKGGKVALVKEAFRLRLPADAWPGGSEKTIHSLQKNLDGYVGTAGDRAAYQRGIDMLAD